MPESSFLILSKNKEHYATQRLLEEAKSLGIKLDFMLYPIVSPVNIDNYNTIINRVSGIDYDDIDLEILERVKDRVINDVDQSRIFRDKFDQYLFYKENSINTPKTKLFEKKNGASKVSTSLSY